MMVTGEKLAGMISEELEKDGWGDIEPYWFKVAAGMVEREENEDPENLENGAALRQALDRVANRLNGGYER